MINTKKTDLLQNIYVYDQNIAKKLKKLTMYFDSFELLDVIINSYFDDRDRKQLTEFLKELKDIQ